MEQYISKSALVAEIERRIKVSQDYAECNLTESTRIGNQAQLLELNDILSFIDTLEVKEVDLEKEIENLIEKEKAFVTDNREVKYYNGDSFNHIYELEFIAKHFFELGLKAKGE